MTGSSTKSHVHVGRLCEPDASRPAPGIDLVDRLATALGCTVSDLLPTTEPPDQTTVLRDQVRRLCDGLLTGSDSHTLSLAAQLLASLASSER